MDIKEYEELEDLFQHPGWKKFVEEAATLAQALRDAAPDYCHTNDHWQYTRGQIHQLDRTVGYAAYVKAAFEQAEADKLGTENDGAGDAALVI